MSAARSYAKALYLAAAEAKSSSQDLDQIESQLDAVAQAIEATPALRMALVGPLVSAQEKAALAEGIAKAAGLGKLAGSFLALLCRKGRVGHIREIRDAFSAVRLEAEGGLLGRLVSADPLEAADVEGLSKAFSRKLGKKVAFSAATDPSLLAGVKVTVNGVTYDGTLRAQLQRLRENLVFNRTH